MHPAAESFVSAGVLPLVACSAVVGGGCVVAAKFFGRYGWIVAGTAAALGLLAGLAVANWRQGLAEWVPEDSFDWLLWAPPLLAAASVGVYALLPRRLPAAGLALAFVLCASWLLTPQRESLGAHRWLWFAATAAGAAWLWFAGGHARARARWTAPLLLALACCGEALIVALSGSLRLADLVTVGGAANGSAVLISLVLRSERAVPAVEAAVFAVVAGGSLLLAAVAVYGAMENFSDTPTFVFYLPLLLPAVNFVLPRRTR